MEENKIFYTIVMMIGGISAIISRRLLVSEFGFVGFWGGLGAWVIAIVIALIVISIIVFFSAIVKSLFFDKDEEAQS